jgi:rubrerythrin
MALAETAGEDETDSQRSSGPTAQHLDCQNCGRTTDHHFETHESLLDETWTGQPIWECQWCGITHHGPALE